MIKNILFFLAIVASSLLKAQDIEGDWNGVLEVNAQTKLRLVVHIKKESDGFKSTLDSPDQGAKDIPVQTTTYDGSTLTLAIQAAGIQYSGSHEGDVIKGTFKQGGGSFELQLNRGNIVGGGPKRPQEPKPPFSYYTEDVVFKNEKAGVTISGTLSLPSNSSIYPVVILISGSGPQNRDEELLGHKPFLVLADYLTKQGIGVLRYDDRGVSRSTGDFKTATTNDFAQDVRAAVAYLKSRKEVSKIGLIGHSEGGMIAPMVAAHNNDIAYIVLLAGPGTRCDELLLKQQELIGKANGESAKDLALGKEINTKIFALINKHKDQSKLNKAITKYLNTILKKHPEALPKDKSADQYIDEEIKSISSPWMLYFLRHDPTPFLRKVKCPTLALNGAKDLQVPSMDNLTAIKNTLTKAGNKAVTIKEYSDLNHLFQHCTTGSPVEYPTIEETMSVEVLQDVVKWIKDRK